MGKMVSPCCGEKGSSVRGERPRFFFEYTNHGNDVAEFRVTLMRCRTCQRQYAVKELKAIEGFTYQRHTTVEYYETLEPSSDFPPIVGSTASEFSKRHAKGIQPFRRAV